MYLPHASFFLSYGRISKLVYIFLSYNVAGWLLETSCISLNVALWLKFLVSRLRILLGFSAYTYDLMNLALATVFGEHNKELAIVWEEVLFSHLGVPTS